MHNQSKLVSQSNKSIFHKYLLMTIACSTMILLFGCSTSGRQTAKPKTTGPFQAQYVASLENPEIVIENRTAKTITLKLSGTTSRTLVIAPSHTDSVTVPNGTYNYHATAPETQPASGVSTFMENYRYTWSFTIQRIYL